MLDFDPREVAKQITLLGILLLHFIDIYSTDGNIFNSIEPWELLDQAWTKGNAPHVTKMVKRFNQINNFVLFLFCSLV